MGKNNILSACVSYTPLPLDSHSSSAVSYSEVERPDDNTHCHTEAASTNTPLQRETKSDSNDTPTERMIKERMCDLTKLETVFWNPVKQFKWHHVLHLIVLVHILQQTKLSSARASSPHSGCKTVCSNSSDIKTAISDSYWPFTHHDWPSREVYERDPNTINLTDVDNTHTYKCALQACL